MNATRTPSVDPATFDPATFDHVSFAVSDALSWAQKLRSEFGATPIAGETLPDFRYLLLYVGDNNQGSCVELIEPTRAGFLTKYLERHGEGPHHLTFMVSDLRHTAHKARELGFTITGEDYDHSPWQEVFLLPHRATGCVIQLAQSDRSFPVPAQLLATQERDVNSFPSSRGATDPLWWRELWNTSPGERSVLTHISLESSDVGVLRALFTDVLGANSTPYLDGARFTWAGGSILATVSDDPGITALTLHGNTPVPDSGNVGLGNVGRVELQRVGVESSNQSGD